MQDPGSEKAQTALVVGRFQPPHRGHLEVLKQAAAAAQELVIVVGSAQRSHTAQNPLTAGERIEAITALLQDAGLQAAHIIPVPDLDQYHLWAAHVAAHVPRFDLVVAASPMTLDLFAKAGHRTKRVETVNREQWSGTAIRRKLLAGQDVTELVTPGVARLLARDGLRQRFQALAASQHGETG